MSVQTDTMPPEQRARIEDVLDAILNGTSSLAEDHTDEPDQMTEAQADREFAVDADAEAARLYC